MELDQDIIVACTVCTSKTQIGSTTYDRTGKNLICFGCYNKIVQGKQPEVYRTIQSENPDRLFYNCVACGYKFSRSKEFKFNGLCFHCGKNTIQIEQTQQTITRQRKTLLDY